MSSVTIRCDIPLEDIKVSNHALARYKQRADCTLTDDELIIEELKKRLAGAVLVEHKTPTEAALALIRHNYEPAVYYRRGGIVFVLAKDNTVLTVHRGEAKKWRPVAPNN
jgi:hypothetical protein